MSDWDDCTFILKPHEEYAPLDIILSLSDYPHSLWQWRLLIQKPWPSVDGLYVPAYVNTHTSVGYTLVDLVNQYADCTDKLVEKLLDCLREDRNPVLTYGSKLYG